MSVRMFAVVGIVFGEFWSSAQVTVPSSLLEAAGRPPLEFVVLLASASVPAGAEIRDAEDDYPARPVAPSLDGPKVGSSDVVAAFNAAHSDYQATLTNGVIVVRPIKERAAFLDSQSTIAPPIVVYGPIEAARIVFAPIDPRLRKPPTLGVATGLDAITEMTTAVTLDGTVGRSVIGTLNQLVTQVPAAWEVVTRRDDNQTRIVAFRWIRKGGGFTRFEIQPEEKK